MTLAAASVLALARAEIRALKPYAHASWAPTLTRMHANELPWPTHDGAELNRYPEPQPAELLTALAKYLAVEPAQVLATHGSDEAIDLITRVFCRAGKDAVTITPPTFGMFSVAAGVQGAAVVEAPLLRDADFALDTAAVIRAIDDRVKIIWLCSPNNPTGGSLKRVDVEQIVLAARDRSLIVIDEAYAEFSAQPSLLEMLPSQPHLIVLRTLSKAHGLAGARLGAAVAHPEIITLLRKIVLPYNLSRDSIAAALLALAPAAIANTRARVAKLVAARESLARDFVGSPLIEKVWASDANFLLLRCRPDAGLFDLWVRAGLLVRDFRKTPGLEHCLRVTIGTDEQNAQLRSVLGLKS